MELGIGVGWLEEEFDALGVSWPRRGARTDEYVHAMRELWASDDASYDGEFVSFENVSSNPKPAGGTVPFVIGGHSAAAAKRAGRLGDGFFPGKGTDRRTHRDDRHRAPDRSRTRSRRRRRSRSPQPTPACSATTRSAQPRNCASIGVSRTIAPAFMLLGSRRRRGEGHRDGREDHRPHRRRLTGGPVAATTHGTDGGCETRRTDRGAAMTSIELDDVDKVYPDGHVAVRHVDLEHRRRRVPCAARPVRLRQEHGAADDRRSRVADRSVRSARRRARQRGRPHATVRSPWRSRPTRCIRT